MWKSKGTSADLIEQLGRMAAGGDDKDTGQATEMGEKFGQSYYVRII